ncbi:telomerase protein component 1-like isoform X1 [Lepisosteus oculatus]|uniref:telomerase protein component 1-like isoform X1 n=1 Tax=Lepisosteus oculatus TaxID=7918 RepID=UPI003711C94B
MKAPQQVRGFEPEKGLHNHILYSSHLARSSGISLENRILAQASAAVRTPAAHTSPTGLHSRHGDKLHLAAGALTATTSPALLPTRLSATAAPDLSCSLLGSQHMLLSQRTAQGLPSAAGVPTAGRHLQPSSLISVWGRRGADKEEVPSPSEQPAGDPQLHTGSTLQSLIPGCYPDRQAAEDVEEMAVEMPVPELELRETSREQEDVWETMGEFPDFPDTSKRLEEELRDKKFLLLNMVCCSLVKKETLPGHEGWDEAESTWTRLKSLAQDISQQDGQFLLKVAVYARQELNMRTTANFLLALAASLPEAKVHLRRYFCPAVQLPSDWIEVARLYSSCFGRNLPSCLKKAMAHKFKQFSEYQLAKYNTRKHRCKHNRASQKSKKPGPEDWKKWAGLLRSEPVQLEKYMISTERKSANKQQSIFNLKRLVQRLHIKEPAEHVMALLGRKYPSSLQAFSRSGLSGSWDSQRSGKRMKLSQPETWERQLSLLGNKARTWEQLIDNKALPFMAMLRNLRSMITAGISEQHHSKILQRLTDKESVIRSRQLPFRFLSAYKVMLMLGQAAKPSGGSSSILKSILNPLPKARGCKAMEWDTTRRRRLRATLGVHFVYRLYKKRKALQQKASQRKYSNQLLGRYREALEKAIQISCKHNIPPLPGRTLIVFRAEHTMHRPCKGSEDICCPFSSEEEKLTPTVKEVAALLGLMIASSCEHAQMVLLSYGKCKAVELQADSLLDNIKNVMQQIEKFVEDSDNDPSFYEYFAGYIDQKVKLDTVIFLEAPTFEREVIHSLHRYKKEVNSEALVVKVFLSEREKKEINPKTEKNYLLLYGFSEQILKQKKEIKPKTEKNCVLLYGFSEQILKFIAERGSSRLLDHVEQIDRLYRIPPEDGAKEQMARVTDICPLLPTPAVRWRNVRVFISSTFRDMHGERDVLVRLIFPELRRRAALYCLSVQEVELRWGVTEEESSRQRMVEMCLSEVCRSQLFVGILGERYGLVPTEISISDQPQFDWLKTVPPGLSVTELEIRQFESLHPDSAKDRTFFYLRTPELIRSVPVSWRADFAAESGDAKSKMEDLKCRVLQSGAKTTRDYPAEWGGVADGKPFAKGLETFGKAVLEDLWGALLEQFVQKDDDSEESSEVTAQEVYQEAQQRLCHGRKKLVATAAAKIRVMQKGGLVFIPAEPGEGKTVFMAALANELKKPSDKSQKTPSFDVISYFASASQSADRVEQLLRCLIQWLKQRLGKEVELPSTYRELLSDFYSQLDAISGNRPNKPLAILIDDADRLQNAQGQLVSDWIPQHLPQGVTLVVSVTSNSALQQTLAKKKSAMPFPLGPLSLPDRKEIVQKGLAMYGKKLSDSAFNNQMQTLLMKKGSVSPLYLSLACEELRAFAVFEKMKEALQTLPPSLGELVQHSLSRLQLHHGTEELSRALGALTVSRNGLRERDLYVILCTCKTLAEECEDPTWQEVMQLSRNPRNLVPMATFTQLVWTLQNMLGQPSSQGPDSYLCLTKSDVRSAFEQLYLQNQDAMRRAHLVLAGHLWVLSDPNGRDTFVNCDAESIVHLPFHLVSAGRPDILCSLLSSFHFLHAHVRLGLLSRLLEAYSLYDSCEVLGNPVTHSPLETCRAFLRHHGPALSRWPALFLQQALNEPEGSAAHRWAQGIVGRENSSVPGVRILTWLNKPREIKKEASDTLMTFRAVPTCMCLHPGHRLAVVGTGQGTLHVINTETGQEVRSLVSSCDGISGCVFLREGLLGSTSFDGRLEVWDIDNGCRTVQVDAHKSTITGCDISADRKNLATVSLDSQLKVWDVPKGSLCVTLTNPCPLNCVTFHPEGQLVAVGGWDRKIRLWNWLTGQSVVDLSGHEVAVRSLSYSPSGGLLTSGCLSGEVRLWSVPAAASVGHYRAHQGSTEVLRFMENGRLLLTAGTDCLVNLWSGNLGRPVGRLGDSGEGGSSATAGSPALCVAVTGDYAAVGYHSDGIQLYQLSSGQQKWMSEDPRVPVRCLTWLQMEGKTEVLVSGSDDHILRVWWGEMAESLTCQSRLKAHRGPILALACSPTLLASASDDFTVALWSVQELASPSDSITPTCVLRGHEGGVTCLSFSPNGQELLSGGKDQTLMVWDVRAMCLSRSFLQCHTDWITGCTWTEESLVSCSNDCRLRVWEPVSGQCVREFLGQNSFLSSVCSLGNYVISGSGSGEMVVWDWKAGIEITRIPAHPARVNHCAPFCQTDEINSQDVKPDCLTVATASDDGTVRLWRPLQVAHHSMLSCYGAGVRASVSEDVVPAFLTVSEDRTLRVWSLSTAMECASATKRGTTALAFSPCGLLLVSGHEDGRLCVWAQSSVICCTQVGASAVSSVVFMSERQLAVACQDKTVSIWILDWQPPQTTAEVKRVSSFELEHVATTLHYCSVLLGACTDGSIVDEMCENHFFRSLPLYYKVLGFHPNDHKSSWVLAEANGVPNVGFVYTMGNTSNVHSGFSYVEMEGSPDTPDEGDSQVTAAAMHKELIVFGDSKGNMWYNQPPETGSWSSKKQVHSDRISTLKVMESMIISASHDRSLKLWDRETKKQVGQFLCHAPLWSLEVNPLRPSELACGDSLGQVYIISWKD